MDIIGDNEKKVKRLQKIGEKKQMNTVLARTYKKLGDEKKARKLNLCARNFVMAEGKILAVMYCQLRLCPVCSWRRADRTFHNVFYIISQPEFKDLDFIFITLTVKNCSADELPATLEMMNKGWRRLAMTAMCEFRRSFEGTFKALEITVNKKTGEYHPHYHILAAVKKGYFRKSNPDYISQENLIKLWQKVCKLDYEPNVDIRRVKNATYKAVAEVAKYSVKATDYIKDEEIVKTLDKVLFRRRLLAYGGIFQVVRKKLKLEEEPIAEGDDSFNASQILANPNIVKEIYKWNFGTKTYELVRKTNLI